MLISEIHQTNFFERTKYDSLFLMKSAHAHNYNELYFLENGQTTYFVGNSIYALNSGDFIFISKGQLHQTDNSSFPQLERVLLNFDDELVGKECTHLLEELRNDPHVRLPEGEIYTFKKMIKMIENETRSDKADSRLMQKLYLQELLVLISRHRKNTPSLGLCGTQKLVSDAVRYISENYAKPIDLAFLAQKYSVSEGHFSKIFKKHTGMRVREYLNVVRVYAAMNMLVTSELSVTDVAFECGFNDSNYFSQVFKGIADVTPKKYALNSKKGIGKE